MPPCHSCQQPASKRNGHDRRGRQKYVCCACRRTYTEDSASAFSGYRWPRDVILTAVRWYLAYPLSSRQVLELLAERGIDVSHRTILDWVQAFGPRLAAEVRRRQRPVGRRWFVDEVFLFRKGQKRYLYRAIDEDGVVIDVLLCEHRDTASAQAFFRQAIERSHVPTRDRLRNSRGPKRTETGQRFLEGFEAVRHLRRGGAPGAGHLVRGPALHARVRQVVAAINTLGHSLRRRP